MKIALDHTPTHQLALTAEVGEYDAAPTVPALTIDHVPRRLHPDRVALAAHLAFGRFTSGELQLPLPCSPAMARAIRRDSDGIVELVGPVELYPQGLPEGAVSARLTTSVDMDPHDPAAVTILPADRWNGALRTPSWTAVGSNAFLLARDEGDVRPILAAAVLLAEDCRVDSLRVRVADRGEYARLATLLGEARLGLENASA